MDHSKGFVCEDWFVIFSDSSYKSWIINRLKPGFSHCYLMKKTEHGNFWQVVNPRLSFLEVKQVLVSEYPHPRLYAGPDSVILPVRTNIHMGTFVGTFCVLNCVSIVKAALGIKNMWVFTPWMLYKYILKRK